MFTLLGFVFLSILFIVGVVAAWLIYFGAKAEKQTCYVPTGEIKFVVAGESCIKVLPNLEGTGYHYDCDKEEIVLGEKPILSPPLSIMGVYWVSIMYPLEQIHVYRFDWDKLLRGDPKKGEETYIVEHRSEYVNSLFFLYAYPIYAKGIELEGNLQININTLVTFRVVKPKIPIFAFKGAWLPLVSAAVTGAITDFTRNKTLDDFRKIEKEGGTTVFSEEIMKLNANIIGVYGIAVHKVDFIGYELSSQAQEVRDATTAVEVAKLTADAAKKKAEEITTIGNAHADALGARLERAAKYPGGLAVLEQQIQGDAIATFKGSFLSISGHQPAPAIVVDSKKIITP